MKNESVIITLQHREEIVQRLTRDLVEEMEKNGVVEADLPQIAEFILEKIDRAKNHHELIALLDELSTRWPFFETVEQLERGEVKDMIEDKVEKDLLTLAKAGNAEDVIRLAKSVMKV